MFITFFLSRSRSISLDHPARHHFMQFQAYIADDKTGIIFMEKEAAFKVSF